LTQVPLRPRNDSDPKANYEPMIALYTTEHYVTNEGQMTCINTLGGRANVADDFMEFVSRNEFVSRPPSMDPPSFPNTSAPIVIS
jgi:hypothetical protein